MSALALRMQHNSLQFSDTPRQQRFDIQKIFTRGGDFPIKTGTEAGRGEVENHNRELLEEFGRKFNHIVKFGRESWVAVDRKIVKRNSLETGELHLADNDEMAGPGHDRSLPWLSFEHVTPGVGRLAVGTVHYPTKGAEPGDPNHELNMKIAEKIGGWFEEHGKGSDLAFLNGDFNMNDKLLDWAGREGNFTSIADELEAWQNTGHGPIDGFCSYDHDERVAPHRFVVLDDKEFKLFSDHYTCRCTWRVRLLKGGKR